MNMKGWFYVLKHNYFLLLFKNTLLNKFVGYKVLIKCFHGKLNVSLFKS